MEHPREPVNEPVTMETLMLEGRWCQTGTCLMNENRLKSTDGFKHHMLMRPSAADKVKGVQIPLQS